MLCAIVSFSCVIEYLLLRLSATDWRNHGHLADALPRDALPRIGAVLAVDGQYHVVADAEQIVPLADVLQQVGAAD